MNSSLNLFISLNLRKFYYDLYLYYLLNPYPSTFQSIIIQSYPFSFPSVCHYHLVLVPISHKFPILYFPSKPESHTNEEKRNGMSQIMCLYWRDFLSSMRAKRKLHALGINSFKNSTGMQMKSPCISLRGVIR